MESAGLAATGLQGSAPLMTKEDHMPIDGTRPGIYEAVRTDGKHCLVAYGGSEEERNAYVDAFLSRPENQGQTVVIAYAESADTGMRAHVEEFGKTRSAWMRYWLGDLFMRKPEAPSPDTFLRRL